MRAYNRTNNNDNDNLTSLNNNEASEQQMLVYGSSSMSSDYEEGPFPEDGDGLIPSPNENNNPRYHVAQPFTLLQVRKEKDEPQIVPSSPGGQSQYYRMTPARSHRNLSFAIMAEAPRSRSPSPEFRNSSPSPGDRSGRVSPFRGRGFKAETSTRFSTPAHSPPSSLIDSSLESKRRHQVEFSDQLSPYETHDLSTSTKIPKSTFVSLSRSTSPQLDRLPPVHPARYGRRSSLNNNLSHSLSSINNASSRPSATSHNAVALRPPPSPRRNTTRSFNQLSPIIGTPKMSPENSATLRSSVKSKSKSAFTLLQSEDSLDDNIKSINKRPTIQKSHTNLQLTPSKIPRSTSFNRLAHSNDNLSKSTSRLASRSSSRVTSRDSSPSRRVIVVDDYNQIAKNLPHIRTAPSNIHSPSRPAWSRPVSPWRVNASRQNSPNRKARARSPWRINALERDSSPKKHYSRAVSPSKGYSRYSSPSKPTRSRASSPTKGKHSRASSPSKRGKSRTSSPQERGKSRNSRVSSPSRGDYSRVTSPSRIPVRTEYLRDSSPSRKHYSRTSSPTRLSYSRTSSPSRREFSRPSSPSRRDRSRASSPSRRDRSRASSPSRRAHSRASSPSRKDRSRASSPSRRDRSRASSPSRRDHSRASSPSRRMHSSNPNIRVSPTESMKERHSGDRKPPKIPQSRGSRSSKTHSKSRASSPSKLNVPKGSNEQIKDSKSTGSRSPSRGPSRSPSRGPSRSSSSGSSRDASPHRSNNEESLLDIPPSPTNIPGSSKRSLNHLSSKMFLMNKRNVATPIVPSKSSVKSVSPNRLKTVTAGIRVSGRPSVKESIEAKSGVKFKTLTAGMKMRPSVKEHVDEKKINTKFKTLTTGMKMRAPVKENVEEKKINPKFKTLTTGMKMRAPVKENVEEKKINPKFKTLTTGMKMRAPVKENVDEKKTNTKFKSLKAGLKMRQPGKEIVEAKKSNPKFKTLTTGLKVSNLSGAVKDNAVETMEENEEGAKTNPTVTEEKPKPIEVITKPPNDSSTSQPVTQAEPSKMEAKEPEKPKETKQNEPSPPKPKRMAEEIPSSVVTVTNAAVTKPLDIDPPMPAVPLADQNLLAKSPTGVPKVTNETKLDNNKTNSKSDSKDSNLGEKVIEKRISEMNITEQKTLEKNVKNKTDVSTDSSNSSLRSSNKDKVTIISEKAKPIRIDVKEKGANLDVQSGNLPRSPSNGTIERPEIAPASPNNGRIPDPAAAEDAAGAEANGAKKSVCSRLFSCCGKPKCCSKCRGKKMAEEPAEQIELAPASEDEEKPPGCCARCFRCCKKKPKKGADTEMVPTASEVSTLPEGGESEPKPGCWSKFKKSMCGCNCCKRKNKVADKQAVLPKEKKTWKERFSCCKRKKKSDNWAQRRDSILSDEPPRKCCRCGPCACLPCFRCLPCCRRDSMTPLEESEPDSRRTSMLDKKKSLTPQAPEKIKPKIDESLVEHSSEMRASIPVLPLSLAYICLVLNIILPGTGTMLSGMFCLCVGIPRFSVHDSPRERIGAFIIDLIIGISQLFTILFCLVGWGWSIWWGIVMLRLARKHRRFKTAEREEEEREAAMQAAQAAQATPAANQNHRDVERGRRRS